MSHVDPIFLNVFDRSLTNLIVHIVLFVSVCILLMKRQYIDECGKSV